jgi:hypothetical protein
MVLLFLICFVVCFFVASLIVRRNKNILISILGFAVAVAVSIPLSTALWFQVVDETQKADDIIKILIWGLIGSGVGVWHGRKKLNEKASTNAE